MTPDFEKAHEQCEACYHSTDFNCTHEELKGRPLRDHTGKACGYSHETSHGNTTLTLDPWPYTVWVNPDGDCSFFSKGGEDQTPEEEAADYGIEDHQLGK